MKNKIFSMFDYILILLAYIVITVGIFFIYSSGFNDRTPTGNFQFVKQIIWAAVGFLFMVFFTLYDYRKLENISMWLFAGSIGLLLIVLIPHIGKDSHNARSWLGIGPVGFQPAEIGKIFYILFLAKYLNDSQNEQPLIRFLKAMVIMAAPFLLILIQPDLGTASVYIPIFLIMCFFAGIPISYLLWILTVGVLTIIFTILPEMNKVIFDDKLSLVVLLTNFQFRLILIGTSGIIALLSYILRKYFHGPKYLNWITGIFSIICIALIVSLPAEKVLSSNQKKRLFIFINPEKDRDFVGYQIIQSKITIGGGNLLGKGFMNGTQTHFQFLPEQSTDFIFSIFSEESG
ncbi:MAG: FtsW/RodA/SpoVE family cell cycle protein, partial [Treponema sp.]|nr:FtsW/RodA/SpoVE family cell cycle protein [Treponema sp.]